MKTKVVLWGENAKDEKVLIAMELRTEENMVDVYIIPEAAVKEDFYRKMMDEWRNGKSVDLPDGTEKRERALSVTESLLPDDLKTEQTDLVNRAQTEWHFAVLSGKLSKAYANELEDLKELVGKAEKFQKDTWDRLKEFWGKVNGQVRERNLVKEHADQLRDSTNALFEQMKGLRKKADEEFRTKSADVMGAFNDKIDEVKQKAESGDRLRPLFDKLVELQREYRETKEMTRDHRNKVWSKLDAAFKEVKGKLFGDDGKGSDNANSPLARIERRYKGLLGAIEKMERSIKRDQDDLEFQNRRIKNSDGQLEAQIRQAKLKMIEERMNSKKEKLADMHKTKAELEQKIEKEKVREEKRKAQAAKDAERKAKEAEAKKKIAEEMKAQQEAVEVDEDKLKAAAEAIQTSKAKKAKAAAPTAKAEASEGGMSDLIDNAVAVATAGIPAAEAVGGEPEAKDEPGILEEVGDMITEAVEDAVDTAKAIAAVVTEKVTDAVEDLKKED